MHVGAVAIAWYIYDVTSSAYALGYLGLAGVAPAVGLVLFTGYAADRIDRKIILFVSDAALTVAGLILLWLIATGYGIVWPIYLVTVLVSASRAFHSTAAQALIPALVPEDQLGKAIAFAAGTFQAAQILGPALGGLLYAVSPLLPFAMASVLYAGSALAALSIRHRSDTAVGKLPVTVQSLMAGIQFAMVRPVVIGAMALDLVVVMFGSVIVLLPIFAKDILAVGPVGLGILRAAPAVGAIAMAMWLSSNNAIVQRNAGVRLFQTVAVFGAATFCFGVSTSLVLSLLCLIVVGASDMVSVVIRHTMVQSETPDALRGRVSAVNAMMTSSSGELGQLRAGIIAGLVGASWAVMLGGLSVIGLAWAWPHLFPGLRDRDHLVEEPKAGAQHAGA